MTNLEMGFLLLASCLGNPDRHPLTMAQLRVLAGRVAMSSPIGADRELQERDLLALGYGSEMAKRILALLSDTDVLAYYLRKGRRFGCVPFTWKSPDYPESLYRCLGRESPGVLWGKGDLSLLKTPMISLVGSRDIAQENQEFAREAGRQAAVQGLTLVSGNARGADRAAQQGCLEAGGRVICVIADSMENKYERKNLLYLCEDSFDFPFSARRALSRNRVIHAIADTVLVAQCSDGTGGTWHGTVANLENNWSHVYCFRDGSPGCKKLEDLGAIPIGREQLRNLRTLPEPQKNLFDQ